MEKIHIEGKTFRDSSGRERIFRGMNFIYTGKAKDYPRDYCFDWGEKELREYSAKMCAEVQKTDARLKETGYRNYTKE